MLEVDSFAAGLVRTLRDNMAPCEPKSAAQWRRAPGTLWRILIDDVVLLATDGVGEPFAMTGGARLWLLLAEPRSLDELADGLGGGSGVQDLGQLLVSLAEARVVEKVGP